MNILETIKLILSDSGYSESITPDTKIYEDLLFTELDLVEFVCNLEEYLNILIDDEEIDTWETIQDIVNTIEKTKNGK